MNGATMSDRPSFDSDTMIIAALAKGGKVILTDEECRAAKKQTIVVNHGEVSVQEMLRENWERWFSLSEDEAVAVKPPQ